jgi:hypothetical protein
MCYIENTLKELCQVSDDKIPQLKVELRLHDGISEYMKPFEGTYKQKSGGGYQNRPMHILPKFECDLVISGYSVKYRASFYISHQCCAPNLKRNTAKH